MIDPSWHLNLADELDRLADQATDPAEQISLFDAAISIRLLVNRINIITVDRQVERRLAYKAKVQAR